MRAAVKIVGMRAGGREHIVAHAREGDPVLLLPEPDNPDDPNAIAVFTAPRAALLHPADLASSVTDPDGVGRVHDEDRELLVDRQAGYVPRGVAATLALPPQGIVGYISAVRWAPTEYDATTGRPLEPRVAGFDVTAEWPRRPGADPGRAASRDRQIPEPDYG